MTCWKRENRVMMVAYALLPLIVGALLFYGLRWKCHELAFLVLLVTICEVSLVPAFHQTPVQIEMALSRGWLLLLSESVVLLPALFFSYVQYATRTCTLAIQLLARMVPSRDLLSLVLVLGIGPCLVSWCGEGAGMILLIPLLACLHQDRKKAVELGFLSALFTACGSLESSLPLFAHLTDTALITMREEMLLLSAPVRIGCSLAVLWLSHRSSASHCPWGTALGAACLTIAAAWCFSQVLPSEAVGMGTGTVVMGMMVLRCRNRTPLPGSTLTYHEAARVLLPYALLCVGFCLSTIIPFPSVSTTELALTPSSLLRLLPCCLPGLLLSLGAFALLRLAPLHRAHLRRVSTTAWSQYLPVALTLGCLWSTIYLMQSSRMVLLLERSLETMHLDAAWVASLLGALQGWLLHPGLEPALVQESSPLVIDASGTLSVSWMLAMQATTFILAAVVTPGMLLLARAVAGTTDPAWQLLRQRGCLLLWGLGVVTLLGTSMLAYPRGVSALAMIVLCIMLIVPCLPLLSCFQVRLPQLSLLLNMVCSRKRLLDVVPRHGFAFGALVLVNLLYASSSLVSLGPLSRLDPTIFLCFQMVLLVPAGLFLLLSATIPLHRALVWRGLQLGGCLAAGLLCVALSLKETGMLETTIFSCLNGVIAMLIARWLLGQRLSLWNWGAGGCLLVGAFLVWLVAPTVWQSNVTAFVAGLLLTCDGFQVEQLLAEYGPEQAPTIRAILGVQCLAMAGLTTIIALCFGHWQTLHTLLPSDLPALCYLSYVTVLLPCLLMLWAQRTLSAVTVACGSVVEPCLSMGASMLLAGERLPPLALLGSGVVLLGMGLQIVGSMLPDMPDTLHPH